MQTLRKKTSPLKYKNETTRFLGDGVSFKAKLIGILEVSEARGDRMCQEALSDLKMAIRAAGEHKQRITINIAIDGLRLRDEKTGDSLYHHPVHKISFIAQDMTDSRAFGYIFGSPDTGHRFFGIKTDKAASQVVIAMRDLFQVVFALKKKEIELAKSRYGTATTSPLFADSALSSVKSITQETTKSTPTNDNKTGGSSNSSNVDTKTTSGGTTAVADLVDLELELNSLQQGLNQMERITPSTTSMVDPFGDSFTTYTKPILPPPPSSGRDRSNRTINDSITTSTSTTKSNVLHDLISSSTTVTSCTPLPPPPPPPAPVITTTTTNKSEFNDNDDWFTTTNNLFEEPSITIVKDPQQQQQQQASKDDKHELTKKEIMSQFDVFTELDPLGTGRSKPYIDKKHFFQELKNPPKKVLKDLVSQSQQQQQPEPLLFNSTLPEASSATIKSQLPATVTTTTNDFTTDPFGEDPFVANDPFADSDFVKQDQFENVEFNDFKKCFDRTTNNLNNDSLFDNKQQQEVSFDVISETSLECAPEPPPRPTSTTRQQQQQQIKPPPLPPKKQSNEMLIKPPPPRPIDKDKQPLYEYIYQGAQNNLEFNTINNNNNNSNNNNNNSVEKTPPLPVPVRKTKFNSDFGNITVQQSQQQSLDYCTKKQPSIQSSDEDYLTPIDIEQKQVDLNLDDLDITLSQLTLSGLNQLAIKLNIPANQLSNMTLVQLTNYLSNFIKSKTTTIPQQEEQPKTTSATINDPNEFPAFKADFATNFNDFNSSDTTTNTTTAYDRYAVFRELIQEEIKQTKIDTEPEELQEEKKEKEKQLLTNLERNEKKIITSIATVTSAITSLTTTTTTTTTATTADKYAALREIVESELKMNTNEQKDNNNDIIDGDNDNEDDEIVKEQNILNKEKCIVNDNDDEGNTDKKDKYNLIEYNLEKDEKVSPVIVKSSQQQQQQQNITDLNSGSLSDIVSGSSPENDNSEQQKLTTTQDSAAGDSWVIFDQNQIVKEKQQQQKQQLPPTATAVTTTTTTTHSEEGVSPWSSDSKEFGNGSPPEWRLSGNDRWYKKRNLKQQQQQQQQQESWWDTSAEPKVQQFPQSNRRSTDSYDDEYYECYERPRRRKHYSGGGGGGGHSSSSRDVSPWEDEPRSRRWHGGRFEKLRDRRHPTDSWEDDDEDDDGDDDDDDYDYDRNVRYHNHRRDYEQNRWMDDWDERRYRRGRWCCPDWEQPELARYPSRYPMEPPNIWRGDRYCNRSGESQESPWEDDYSNDVDGISAPVPPAQQHLNKRNWKRPSSASEMDRKTGEIKSRHYLISGSSDGERERRYKPNRRSRSRDSQYSEPIAAGPHRHKSEISGGNSTVRSSHKSRPYFRESSPPQSQPHPPSSTSLINRKSATLSRKKIKDESVSAMNTFPRKSTTTQNRSTTKSLFENDFVATPENSPIAAVVEPLATKIADKENPKTKFKFDHDFEAESPTILLKKKSHYHHQQQHHQSSSPTLKSLFEDDFSPGHNIKSEQKIAEDIGNISSIKEEINDDYDVDDDNGDFNVEEIDSFNTATKTTAAAAATAKTTNPMARKKKFSRFASNGDTMMMIMMQQLKKSESVNIFARENDPFDDDFFSETQQEQQSSASTTTTTKTTDLKWTEDLEK